MGNRIIIDEICQQLRCIYRIALRNLQNEVQNESPYFVRNGQFESVIVDLRKEALETEAYLLGFRKTRELLLRTTLRKPLSRVLVTFSRSSHSPSERSEQCLMNADGSRSAWYQQLTADFYVK